MDALVASDLFGLGQCSGTAVDPAMDAAALNGVGGLCPLALNPFEISEPWAILELVHHTRRHVGLIRPQRRRREGELGLFIHHER